MVNMYCFKTSFVAKTGVRNLPGIGKVAEIIGCIFLQRGDTKEKRAESIKQILDRQVLSEAEKAPQHVIFPEGATTNGTSLIQFKKGPFVALKPLSIVVLQYKTSTRVKPTQDVLGFMHINLYGACGIISLSVNQLPVFAPNDYFWKHHWREGKEEKWEAYARAVRQIMSEASSLKLSDQTMQDKFDYIA